MEMKQKNAKMAVFQNSQFSKKKVSSKFLAMLNIMLYNVSNFSQGEKEKTGCKVVQIHKITMFSLKTTP